MVAELLAGVDVGDVYFVEPDPGAGDGVADGVAVVGEGPWVHDHGVEAGPLPRRLEPTHDLTLDVALPELDLTAEFARPAPHALLDVGQRLGAVHAGLPATEQVQIRPVDDEDTRHVSAQIPR